MSDESETFGQRMARTKRERTVAAVLLILKRMFQGDVLVLTVQWWNWMQPKRLTWQTDGVELTEAAALRYIGTHGLALAQKQTDEVSFIYIAESGKQFITERDAAG